MKYAIRLSAIMAIAIMVSTFGCNNGLIFTGARAYYAMARDRLLNTVWGQDFFGDSRTLDVHIAWLRDKISASTAKITTVWGFGYALATEEAEK